MILWSDKAKSVKIWTRNWIDDVKSNNPRKLCGLTYFCLVERVIWHTGHLEPLNLLMISQISDTVGKLAALVFQYFTAIRAGQSLCVVWLKHCWVLLRAGKDHLSVPAKHGAYSSNHPYWARAVLGALGVKTAPALSTFLMALIHSTSALTIIFFATWTSLCLCWACIDWLQSRHISELPYPPSFIFKVSKCIG